MHTVAVFFRVGLTSLVLGVLLLASRAEAQGVEAEGRRGPARMGGRTDFFLGARAPFGFSLMFGPAPFDVFAELVAGLWFLQDPRAHVDAALGGRFWF